MFGIFLRSKNVLRGFGFPPIRAGARESRFINDSQTAADAEELERVLLSQSLHQRQHFPDGLFEWTNFSNLRADMHLYAAQMQVLEFGRPGINVLDLLESDSELVLIGAGCDFFMGMRLHVRIDTNCYRRGHLESSGYLIDSLELRLAFCVKGVNAFAQSEFDFAFGFANAAKGALGRIPPGFDDALEFPAANNIKTAAEPSERAKDGS